MNDPHGFTKENLLNTLPAALAGDPKMVALAGAIAGLLVRQKEEIGQLSIYPQIGWLDESLLDILAHDFKVDWWDSDYSLEGKRRTLQSSWQVHRVLGTKAAVEMAASAVYPITTVQEWFEYGGKPYYFRLNVQLSDDTWDDRKHQRLKKRLQYYKNLRSWLEPIVYQMPIVILENRQQFYFTALHLYFQLTITKSNWAFEHFLWTSHILNPGKLADVSMMRIFWNSRNVLGVRLPRFTVLARVNNWGQEVVLLDGRRSLDGSWLLDQALRHGLALQRVGVHLRQGNPLNSELGVLGVWCKILNLEKAAPAVGIKVGASSRILIQGPSFVRGSFHTAHANPQKESLLTTISTHVNSISQQWIGFLCGARFSNLTRAGLQNVRFAAKVRNAGGISASRTTDNMRCFDGSYQFDGSRKWNAKIERSDL